MSTILTLLINLHKSNEEGRLLDLEFQRTLEALSDLARDVPVEPRTDLSAAVSHLASTIRRPTSADHQTAFESMSTACADAGAPLTLLGWIGG
jgi:hypothetical protein